MLGLTHPIKFVAATAAVLLLGGIPHESAIAQDNVVRQPLYIPDPTPRPPDLEKIYEQNPQQKAREQQIAQLKSARRRAQVSIDSDKIAALAEQLRASLAQSAADNNPAYNALKVAEIQKLAKEIKNLEKLQ